MDWRTDEPPIGVEIVYERQDGIVVKGKLVPAGQFGIGDIVGAGANMRRLFAAEGGSTAFEVTRWQGLKAGQI